MEERKYTVMILKKGSEVLDKSYKNLFMAFDKYKKEMAEITEKDERYYDVAFAFSSNDAAYICVAIDKEYNIYGFILLEFDFITRTLWTSHVYVAKECRKNGVYKMMMKRVKKFAKDAKFERIFSLVYKNNLASSEAHRKEFGNSDWVGYEMEVKNGPEE